MKKLLIVFLACVFCSSCSLQLYEPASEGYVVYDYNHYHRPTTYYHRRITHYHHHHSHPPRHYHPMPNRYQKPPQHKPSHQKPHYQKPPQRKPDMNRPAVQRPPQQRPQSPPQRPAHNSGGTRRR